MAITFGSASAPSQKTTNFDAVFTASLANHRRTLADNISTNNALWLMIKRSGNYVSVDGGTNIEVPLMYAMGNAASYSSYDVLGTDPIEGITKAIFEWRQVSIPVTISWFEERQNAQKVLDLLATKIKQAELGLQDYFGQSLLRGQLANGGSGSIETAHTNVLNGSLALTPLANLIQKDPTSSENVGNINQSTSSWWQNQTDSSSASTITAFLLEMETMYNNCSNGPGGPPDLIITDQTTFELLKIAMYHRTRHEMGTDIKFPFENVIFRRAKVVYDEFMPDVQNDTITPSSGKGTVYMINSQFFNVTYDTQGNFRHRPFSTPDNQDARVSHIFWMGNTTVNNRRKHGVLYNIARTLTIGDA
ncbi:hypothetical protein LCGC14_1086360 [marine sediment metagenome]|uniref:Bacteriophage Mu GpT domain-containing protein n=1 Tax=marine sediment metagenome TaxID=412755 RepID=A0A0F9QJM1_9ZZZZ